MIYKKLYIQVVLRVGIILLLCLVTSFLCFATSVSKTIAIPLLLMIGISTYRLVYFLNRTNRLLSSFFDAVDNNDSALQLSTKGYDENFVLVKESLNRLNLQLQDLKIKNEQTQLLLEAIIENAAVGIICMDERGAVQYSSKRGRNMFGLQHLSQLKALLKIDKKLVSTIENLKDGQQQLYKLKLEGKHAHLVFYSASLKQKESTLRIISFTDIQNQLVSNELDSWQKLIRVLNHEIMNSIAPITSLSDSLYRIYEPMKPETPITETILQHTQTGLEVITEQGKGLISFVQSYRELTRLPDSQLQAVSVDRLFKKVQLLMQTEYLNHCEISYQQNTNPDLEVMMDEAQMIQVITNLIKNASEAISNSGKIILKSYIDKEGMLAIEVSDNGPGIDAEHLKSIFVPFFTTKTNGSGIGLTIVSQIIRKHNGELTVETAPGVGTTFRILLMVLG